MRVSSPFLRSPPWEGGSRGNTGGFLGRFSDLCLILVRRRVPEGRSTNRLLEVFVRRQVPQVRLPVPLRRLMGGPGGQPERRASPVVRAQAARLGPPQRQA